MLLFPKGRLRLEVVHQELTRRKRVAPVSAGYHHQHDALAHRQPPHAVNQADATDIKALPGLRHQSLEAALGHAGVVLQLQRLQGITGLR